MPQLKRNIASLPAIKNWQMEEVVQDSVNIAGLELSFCGIQASHPKYGPIVGSATEAGDHDPWDRAWHELLERVSIIEAIHAAPSQFVTRDMCGKPLGMLPFNQVFPSPPQGEETIWQPAKSNGVAIEQSWEKAAARAVWELAERHLLLESWLGIRKPRRLPNAALQHASVLSELYDIQCVTFGVVKAASSEVHSCGVFLFPKNEKNPLIFGFGAALEEGVALIKAETEALQRLSFLWSEEIPTTPPELAPHALFHQDFFLVPNKMLLIKKWLNGDFLNVNQKKPTNTLAIQLVDLSRYAPDGLQLARAVSPDAIPLMFGCYQKREFKNLESERLIHRFDS